MPKKSISIGFLHKAMLFGGAERLVLDLALSAAVNNHESVFYTTEYTTTSTFKEFDEERCISVKMTGSFIPSRIFGRFHALCNLLRLLWLTLYALFFTNHNVYVVDQISYTIPLLRLKRKPIIYYCHFPEALLDDNKPSFISKIYRMFFDTWERYCVGSATFICYNSEFTKQISQKQFRFSKSGRENKEMVLYPCVSIPSMNRSKFSPEGRYFISLNRFETRKNIKLALLSYLSKFEEFMKLNVGLKIAGGLSKSNPDSLKCYEELEQLISSHNAHDWVTLHPNISAEEKDTMLQ